MVQPAARARARPLRSSARALGLSRGSTARLVEVRRRRLGRAAPTPTSQADDPEAFAAGGRARPAFRFPGGESLRRAGRARRRGPRRDRGGRPATPALVVCHGGVIRAARRVPLGADALGDARGRERLGAPPVTRARAASRSRRSSCADVRRVLRHAAAEAHAAAGAATSMRHAVLLARTRDGRFDRARVRFLLKEDDDVTVDVVDADGDRVRRLADGAPRCAPTRRCRLRWDGRDDAGRPAPRRHLPRAGSRCAARAARSLLPERVRKDVTPPRPRVIVDRPAADARSRAPELLPRPPRRAGARAAVRPRAATPACSSTAPTCRARASSWSAGSPDGATASGTWDGTVDGRPRAPAGHVPRRGRRSRDEAGNIGTSPSPLPPQPAVRRARSAARAASRSATSRAAAAERRRRGGGRRRLRRASTAGSATRWPVRRVGEPRRPLAAAARHAQPRARCRRRAASRACTSSRSAPRTPRGRGAVRRPVGHAEPRVLVVLPVHDLAGPQPGRRRRRRAGPTRSSDGLPGAHRRGPTCGDGLPAGRRGARGAAARRRSTARACATTSRPTSRSPAAPARSSSGHTRRRPGRRHALAATARAAALACARFVRDGGTLLHDRHRLAAAHRAR